MRPKKDTKHLKNLLKTLISSNMTEHQHTVAFATWLRSHGYRFAKLPNETFTKSWNQKRKNTLEWVSAWFPDFLIVLKRWSLLFIELKKERWKRWGANGSNYSDPNQLEWLSSLDSINNVKACFASWWEDAVRIVEECETMSDYICENVIICQ